MPRCCDGLGRGARMPRRPIGRGPCCRLRREHRLLVVGLRLALHERDGPGRACRQAVAQPVAVVVAQEPRLAAHQADRALVACFCAQPASVAGNLVYLHDRTDHLRLLRLPRLPRARNLHHANRRPRPSLLLFEASLPSRPPLFCCIYNISHSTTVFSFAKKRLWSPRRGSTAPQRRDPSARQLGSSAVPQDSLGFRISPSLFFHSPARLLPAGTPPAFSATIRRPGGQAVPCARTTGPRHPKMFHVKHSFAIPTTHSPRHERCPPSSFLSFSCTSFPQPPCLPLIDRRFSSALPPPSLPTQPLRSLSPFFGDSFFRWLGESLPNLLTAPFRFVYL